MLAASSRLVADAAIRQKRNQVRDRSV
jgi:hypothetical protein